MFDVNGVVSYSVEEIAEILKLNPRTIRKYINNGIFPKNKVCGRLYVPAEDLEKYLKEKGVKI